MKNGTLVILGGQPGGCVEKKLGAVVDQLQASDDKYKVVVISDMTEIESNAEALTAIGYYPAFGSHSLIADWVAKHKTDQLQGPMAVRIELSDNEGNSHSFGCGYDESLNFTIKEFDPPVMSGSDDEESPALMGPTDEALITTAYGKDFKLNGDGWRDIDANDALADFVQKVVFGESDPDEYMAELAPDGEPAGTITLLNE